MVGYSRLESGVQTGLSWARQRLGVRQPSLCITHNFLMHYIHMYLYYNNLCSLWRDA